MTTSRRSRTGALGALLTAALLVLLPATAASAAPDDGTSYIRVGHFVPGFGGVSMSATLTAYDGSTQPMVLAPEATYGALTSYQPLPVGYYSVAVRPAGAPASSDPVLTGTLEAVAGRAYTVTGLGDATTPRLTAITDDLTPPAAGRAKVRVLPVAVPGATTDVAVIGAAPIASAAAFSEPTSYSEVAAGRVTLRASTGGRTGTADADLAAGSISTIVVLDDGKGGLEVRAVTDATGAGVVPVGGADTGGGGLATAGPSTALVVAGGLGAAAAGAAALVLLRRRSPAVATR